MNRRSALEFSPGAAGPLLARDEDAGRDWRAAGLCTQADPEAWHPTRGASARKVKAICARCPVRVPCLDFAMAHPEVEGVWGGLSERERNGRRAAAAIELTEAA